MKNKKFIWAVMLPTMLHMLVFIVVPIAIGLVVSFCHYNPLSSDNSFAGLGNFRKLLEDADFRLALRNTFVFVFATGFLNMVLNSVGLKSVNWLGDPKVIMISLIIYTLWVDIGYNIILFSAGIDGIPAYVYEAADLDGASEWRKFRKVTLPLLGRSFQFVIVQTLISHFQMFAQFSVLILKDGPQNSGLVLSRYIYKTAFEYKDMGYASAISMVLFIIIMILSLIEHKRSAVDWEY